MQVQHVAAARAKPPTETSCHRKPDPERLGTSYARFALFVERSRGGREGAKREQSARKLLALTID